MMNMTRNLKTNIDEIRKRRAILNSLPPLVYIELTHRCNCSCPMCYRQSVDPALLNNPQYDMSIELYERLAKELYPAAKLVDLRGFGETTIYPEFRTILEYNRKSFPDTTYKLISNGKHLPDDMMQQMLALDLCLYISFDAAEKALFEYLRKGNRFEAVVDHIKTWNACSKKDNKIRLLTTVHNYNVDQLAEIAQFAVESDCQLLSLCEIDAPPDTTWVADYHETLEAISNSIEICAAAGVDVVFPSRYRQDISLDANWKVVEIRFCSAPWNSVLVKSNGDIYSCSHRFCSMGNICKQSFDEIWNGERFQKLREGVGAHSPLLLDSPCHGCNRNDLTYLGVEGRVREKTWELIDAQQSECH